MRRHQHGGAEVGDVFQQVGDLPGGLDIEVAGRFVRDQQRRLADHRARHGHSLLLAAGKLVRKGVGAIAEADRIQRVKTAVARFLVGDAEVGHLQRKGDVFERGQARQQLVVLEDHTDAATQVRDLGR